jgi:hypothetical protein
MSTDCRSPFSSGAPCTRAFLLGKNHQVYCGKVSSILAVNLYNWPRRSLGCAAGRCKFAVDRYFAVMAVLAFVGVCAANSWTKCRLNFEVAPAIGDRVAH